MEKIEIFLVKPIDFARKAIGFVGFFEKAQRTNTISEVNLLRFDPHPSGMRLKSEGLSHGLKTVHRTVFTRPAAGPPFRVPLPHKK